LVGNPLQFHASPACHQTPDVIYARNRPRQLRTLNELDEYLEERLPATGWAANAIASRNDPFTYSNTGRIISAFR